MSKNKNKAQVGMTERQQQEAKEAKSVKRMTFTFVTVIILCVAIFAGSLLAAPIQGLITRATKAVTIGNHTLSGAELNYFYVDAISSYYNQYGSYISYMGLSTSKPLGEQVFSASTGKTWADYFLETAINNAVSTYALYDEAMRVGFKLDAEAQKSLDDLIPNLEETIDYYRELYESVGYTYNYKNAADYLKGIYGNGTSLKSYKNYYEICFIADNYYSEYYDGLEYTDADLRAYEKEKMSDYSSFTYNYYQFSVSKFLEGGTTTKDENGKETTTYSDEEKEAARLVAEGLANKLAEGTYETLEDFDNALNALMMEYEASKKTETSAEEAEGTTAPTEPEATEPEATEPEGTTPATEPEGTEPEGTEPEGTTPDDGKEDEKEDDKKEEDKKKTTSTLVEDSLGSKVNELFIEWLSSADRKEGDLTVIENATEPTEEGGKKTVNGYYVVRYTSTNENLFKLVNVRHILVAFEGGSYNSQTGQTTYSDKEKAKAKEDAEKLLAQWEAGAKTEESFAELANKESDDGDGTTGGLYEDVYPGQMVTNFNDWCFAEGRKEGDTGVVESNYGYHVMYFSGFSDTNYRDFLITNDVRNEDVDKWHTALIEAMAYQLLTDKCVNKDITIAQISGS